MGLWQEGAYLPEVSYLTLSQCGHRLKGDVPGADSKLGGRG